MYTNVKNEVHQKDPQLKMPCKKSNAYLFVCLFVFEMKTRGQCPPQTRMRRKEKKR
jgi:hypothetical protein